jgi:hypothetical protein
MKAFKSRRVLVLVAVLTALLAGCAGTQDNTMQPASAAQQPSQTSVPF